MRKPWCNWARSYITLFVDTCSYITGCVDTCVNVRFIVYIALSICEGINLLKKQILKGVFKEYTWGCTYEQKPHDFLFHLFQLIAYSAIAKTIFARSLIFHIFSSVEIQPLNQRLKRRIILRKLQNFSPSSLSYWNNFVLKRYII